MIVITLVMPEIMILVTIGGIIFFSIISNYSANRSWSTTCIISQTSKPTTSNQPLYIMPLHRSHESATAVPPQSCMFRSEIWLRFVHKKGMERPVGVHPLLTTQDNVMSNLVEHPHKDMKYLNVAYHNINATYTSDVWQGPSKYAHHLVLRAYHGGNEWTSSKKWWTRRIGSKVASICPRLTTHDSLAMNHCKPFSRMTRFSVSKINQWVSKIVCQYQPSWSIKHQEEYFGPIIVSHKVSRMTNPHHEPNHSLSV